MLPEELERQLTPHQLLRWASFLQWKGEQEKRAIEAAKRG